MTDDAIVIVGGGIVGASIAFHLRTADRPIILIEKNEPGGGTTGTTAGQFTHHQTTPDADEYERRRVAWQWYEKHIEDGHLSFDQVGTLHTAGSEREAAVLEQSADAIRSFGGNAEFVLDEMLGEFGIDTEMLHGGLYFPEDGVLDAQAVVEYLLGAAARAGVSVETGVAVTDVSAEGGSVTGISTTEGDRPATTVVNAAGPWAPRLNEQVGISVPLRQTKGPLAVFTADIERTLPLTLFPEGYYVRRSGTHDDGLLVGSFATDYAAGTTLDPDESLSVDESFRSTARQVVGTFLPETSIGDIVGESVGLRTVTPDGRPIVDRTPVDGFVLACGMSGYGITLAPAVGKLLADWFRTGRRPTLLEALSRTRFQP